MSDRERHAAAPQRGLLAPIMKANRWSFPNAKHDDQVDPLMQLLEWFTKKPKGLDLSTQNLADFELM